MNKRVMAFLLCLCMVLGMIPSNFAFMAKAAGNELVLDANKVGLCSACNKEVTWTAYSGSGRMFNVSDDSHKHIYLTADANVALDSYFGKITKGAVCLHLNGHSLSYDGYIQVTGSTATLNIMGDGEVVFTGAAEQDDGWWKFGIYITSSGKVNLLGGTYSTTGVALEAGCPMVQQTTGTVKVDGATINGPYYEWTVVVEGGSVDWFMGKHTTTQTTVTTEFLSSLNVGDMVRMSGKIVGANTFNCDISNGTISISKL